MYVLFCRRGQIKVADFGLSKIIGFGTKLKTFVGTPHYIAPEVLRNGVLSTEDTYTLSADMWSLGCILYRYASSFLTSIRQRLWVIKIGVIDILNKAQVENSVNMYIVWS